MLKTHRVQRGPERRLCEGEQHALEWPLREAVQHAPERPPREAGQHAPPHVLRVLPQRAQAQRALGQPLAWRVRVDLRGWRQHAPGRPRAWGPNPY